MHISRSLGCVYGTQDRPTWTTSSARQGGGHYEGEVFRKRAGASNILRFIELLRKIPIQPLDRIIAIAQITVQRTEVVVGPPQ